MFSHHRLISICMAAAVVVPAHGSVPTQKNEKPTTESFVKHAAAATRHRFLFDFWRAGVHYPAATLVLIALKKEKRLEVWSQKRDTPVFVKSYPILGASGVGGPKLREGDLQVPEGTYQLTGLDPASRFYLAISLNYPNEEDRLRAKVDGRSNPGGDIQIHGKTESTGCLAVGDPAMEELFLMAADTGQESVRVIIAPNDLRKGPPAADLARLPAWVRGLYLNLAAELKTFHR